MGWTLNSLGWTGDLGLYPVTVPLSSQRVVSITQNQVPFRVGENHVIGVGRFLVPLEKRPFESWAEVNALAKQLAQVSEPTRTMQFEPDLSDAGAPDAPNFLKHKPLGVGQVVAAPDGRESRTLVRGTWGTEVLPELAPEEGDLVVAKHRYSGFFETELDAILRERGIDSLVFTGCTTSVCVDSTLRDAFYRDYRCLLLRDCTGEPIGSDLARSNHEATLLVIETLFGWVSDSRSLLRALRQDDAAVAGVAHRLDSP